MLLISPFTEGFNTIRKINKITSPSFGSLKENKKKTKKKIKKQR